MAEEVVILMNDCQGTKLPGRISSTVGRLIPTLSNPSPCNVLRGELLVPIRNQQSGQNDGRPQANHYVKKDPNIILYCKAEEVSPLDQQDSWLLEGIESASVRHAVFVGGNKLEWGSHLVVNDTLYAAIPGPNPVVRECVTAIVRYVGPVRGLPGYLFGIEIMDDAFRGNGTTDGTCNGQRYFACEDKCGLFISLDKISLDPIPLGVQGQHQKTAATTSQSYASALGKAGSDPPANNTRSKRGKESSTDPPSRPCLFNMNEKVIVYDKRGNKVRGTILWCGRKTKSVTFDYMVVGITTESKVSVTDFESSVLGLTHLISAPKGHALFLPETLVTSLEDKHLPETKKSSDVDLNSSIAVAKAFGLTKEELMRQQTEGMQLAKQNLAVKDATRGSNQQQGAPSQGGTYTPEMTRVENLRKQKSQPTDHYEPIPGLEKPTPAERGKLRGQGRSPSIEHRPNVQDVSSWQLEQQKHDILHKNAGFRQQQPEKFQRFDSSPGHSSTLDQRNQLGSSSYSPQQNAFQQSQDNVGAHANQRGPSGHDPQLNVYENTEGLHAPHNRGSGSFQDTSRPPSTHAPQISAYNVNPPVTQQNIPASDPQTRMPEQQNVASVVPSHPQGSQWQPLDVGSTIQIPSTERDHPMRYGVIRWIGELPAVEGLIAGIELDEEMEGCTDGTWATTGQAFFHCPPGKGLYYGLYNLKPDSRFNALSAMSLNPLAQVPEYEENDQALTYPSRQIDKYLGEGRGIQGHQNSCYLDSTVFGLFGLSSEFDDMFLEPSDDPVRNQIRTMLWKGIVNPLRRNGVVKFESVMKLRKELDQLEKMKGIAEDEKDPEEFLNMLFKHTLQVTPFISIKRPFGVEQEFFVQLFLEFDESMKLPTVGDLLKKMFKEQSISFTEVPPKLLIQVPRYGKQFKTFEKVVPPLTLNIAEIVDTPCAHLCFICDKPTKKMCKSCKDEFKRDSDPDAAYFCDSCSRTVHDVPRRKHHQVTWCAEVQGLLQLSELELLSVICIETSHYVCFTRCENRWVFFDSMANRVHDQFNIPKVVECTYLLNEWVYPEHGDLTRLRTTPSRELPEYVRRFTKDVYLCVYIQPDVGMY